MSKFGVNGNFSGEILLRRIQKIVSLNSSETDLVLSLQRSRLHSPGASVSGASDGSAYPSVIVVGWACRPRILPDGRCQILSVQMPGDLVGDCGTHRPLEMSPVVALTSTRTVSAQPLFEAIERDPAQYANLQTAIAKLGRLAETQLIDQVIRLGCQNAVQRISHCLLEFYHRADAIGFVQGGCFPMPLTQEIMGELLGLSLVHVNRVLSQLKRQELIEMRTGVVCIRDIEKLALLADYTLPERRQAAPVEHEILQSMCR